MGWKSLFGVRERSETEQIAASRYTWEFQVISRGFPVSYCWRARAGNRLASLHPNVRMFEGTFCRINLRVDGVAAYRLMDGQVKDEVRERDFSQALWVAEKFLDGIEVNLRGGGPDCVGHYVFRL
jgi:hypothetical protein